MSLLIENEKITDILLNGEWYKVESFVIDAYEIGFFDKDYDAIESEGKFFLMYQPKDCSTGFKALIHNYNNQGGYIEELIFGPMSSIKAVKVRQLPKKL